MSGPETRAGISALALTDEPELAEAVGRLAADLESGEWDRRYAGLRRLDWFDAGYRLVVSSSRAGVSAPGSPPRHVT